jgi:tetratricopeptide (TPR) repeat protein
VIDRQLAFAIVATVLAGLVVVLVPPVRATVVALPENVRVREGFRVPRPSGLEARIFADAVDGRLDEVDLLTAALVASGVPEERIRPEHQRIGAALAVVRDGARAAPTVRARGERLLRGLHGSVLRRYVETQSRVDVAVDTGEFNCLSSAVLFVVAADGLLEHPRGMISRTHAFARVDVDGRVADVETTTPAGFAVDRTTLVTPAYLARLGVGDGLTDAERAADLKNPEEVNALGLVAGLYSNRGVLLVREGDVEGAAIAFDRATRLARGAQQARVAEWRGALLNNATQSLLDAGRLDDARALLALALGDIAPGPTRTALLANVATVAVAQGERAAAAGDDVAARAFFAEAQQLGVLSADANRRLQQRVATLDGQIAAARGGDVVCVAGAAEARCQAAAARVLLEQNDHVRALSAARRARALDGRDEVVAAVFFNALVVGIDVADDAGDCSRVEVLAREAAAVARGLRTPPRIDPARHSGACWWGRGDVAAREHRVDDALAFYARARQHLPDEDGLRRNMVGVLLKRAVPLVNGGQCDDARPVIARAFALARAGEVHRDDLLATCANNRAAAAGRQGDWAAAVDELRRGLLDVPLSESLQEGLASMLHNVAIDHLKAGRCADARAALPELRRLGRSATVELIDGRCAGR